ncbi:MAG: SsrA-binding protein SmpB [Acidobacteriota bacterium]
MARKKKKPTSAPSSDGERAICTNRQARFHYELLDTWEAGLVLMGSEVKSCRAAKVSLAEAHVRVRRGEAWLVDAHFSPYEHAGYAGHEPRRPRKLLLHRREIEKMDQAVQRKGLTLVPTRLYFKGARIKLELRLGRGKKLHDKRETTKKAEDRRDADRAVRAASRG